MNILTPTELKIINNFYWQGLKKGRINRQRMTRNLKITHHTLQSHLKSIYEKLNVHDITSAIIKARDVFEII
jgi:DNA-binding NarL/FixJ family response regulator